MKSSITLALSAVLSFCSLNAQVVTTFAGQSYFGGGDYNSTPNNPVMSEKYSFPSGLCIDQNNKVYVTDEHNIMLIDGSTSRIRGGYLGDPSSGAGYDNSAGTQSLFNTPRGMALMSDNTVLIVDHYNHLIRKISAFSSAGNTQLFSTYCGAKASSGGYLDGTSSTARFNQPYDIVITSTGVVYVSDAYNNCIRKISGGQVSTVAGTTAEGDVDGVGTNARFNYPMGICLENDNSLLIVDRNNGKLRRLNLSTKEVTTVISSGLSPDMSSDVVVVDGMIYVADYYCIRQWDGTSLTVFAGEAGTNGMVNGNGSAARFGELDLMTYDPNNKCIYVADRENNVIRKVTIAIPPTADFVANNTSVTIGQTVKLTNKSKLWNSLSWAITPTTYTLVNSSTLTDTVVYVKFNVAGAYQISLTATNTSGSDVETKTNYINVSNITGQAPAVDFTANNTTPKASSETVNFIDYSTNNPTSWEWTFAPNTVSFTGGTNMNSQYPQVIFNASGNYNVTLKATNGTGSNSLTKTAYIKVQLNSIKNNSATIPFTFYPSPASDRVSVWTLNPVKSLQLFSLDGKLIASSITGELSVASVPNGIYLVICKDIVGNTSRQKLQVLH